MRIVHRHGKIQGFIDTLDELKGRAINPCAELTRLSDDPKEVVAIFPGDVIIHPEEEGTRLLETEQGKIELPMWDDLDEKETRAYQKYLTEA